MDKIRVLRVLEYTYDNMSEYEKDRAMWTHMSRKGWTPKMRTVGVHVEELTPESIGEDQEKRIGP